MNPQPLIDNFKLPLNPLGPVPKEAQKYILFARKRTNWRILLSRFQVNPRLSPYKSATTSKQEVIERPNQSLLDTLNSIPTS